MLNKFNENSKSTIIWLILPTSITIILYLLNLLIIPTIFPSKTEQGQFGDMFGAVNALFSGLAFVILIYTIRQQKEEIELQRIDLKLQIEEMSKQREEFEKQRIEIGNQNKILKIQQFENTYFNILKQYNEYHLKLYNRYIKLYNNHFLDVIGEYLINKLTQEEINAKDIARELKNKKYSSLIFKEIFYTDEFVEQFKWTPKHIYDGLFTMYNITDLENYFKYVEYIIDFIHKNNDLSFNEKINYINLFKLELSHFQKVLLYVRCISMTYKISKLITSLDRYKFFENEFDNTSFIYYLDPLFQNQVKFHTQYLEEINNTELSSH